MGFELKKGKNYTLIPSGSHLARCHLFIDLGTQEEKFQGQAPKQKPKIRIGFALPTELHVFEEKKGPEPFTISEKLTNSMHEKSNLRPFLVSWRGRDFSPEELNTFRFDKLLGAPAQITIIHKKNTKGDLRAEIASICKPIKGVEVPPLPPSIVPLCYTIDNGPDDPVFKKLPEWMREECAQCLEWKQQEQEQRETTESGGEAVQPADGTPSDDPF